MARRKKHAKKRHHTKRRRHHMAGISGTLTNVAYIAGGAIVAQVLGNVISKATASSTMSATTKSLINGAVPIAAGVYLPKFVKGPMGAGLGAGMIAVGSVKLAQSTGVLAGVGAVVDRMTSNYGNMPVRNIAGSQLANKGTYLAGVKNAAILEHC